MRFRDATALDDDEADAYDGADDEVADDDPDEDDPDDNDDDGLRFALLLRPLLPLRPALSSRVVLDFAAVVLATPWLKAAGPPLYARSSIASHPGTRCAGIKVDAQRRGDDGGDEGLARLRREKEWRKREKQGGWGECAYGRG